MCPALNTFSVHMVMRKFLYIIENARKEFKQKKKKVAEIYANRVDE